LTSGTTDVLVSRVLLLIEYLFPLLRRRISSLFYKGVKPIDFLLFS
jgi:hypothetical protein